MKWIEGIPSSSIKKGVLSTDVKWKGEKEFQLGLCWALPSMYLYRVCTGMVCFNTFFCYPLLIMCIRMLGMEREFKVTSCWKLSPLWLLWYYTKMPLRLWTGSVGEKQRLSVYSTLADILPNNRSTINQIKLVHSYVVPMYLLIWHFSSHFRRQLGIPWNWGLFGKLHSGCSVLSLLWDRQRYIHESTSQSCGTTKTAQSYQSSLQEDLETSHWVYTRHQGWLSSLASHLVWAMTCLRVSCLMTLLCL